ncbi:MAG: hypothetical protein WBX00_36125 [Isosphaeraceae bacterium]
MQAGTAVVPGRGDDQHVPIPGVPDRPGQEILRLAGRDPLPAADVADVRPRLDRRVDGAGEIQLREVPLLSEKIGTISPRHGASPWTRPSWRPKITLATWVPCRLIPPPIARPLARVASGVRSTPAKQGCSRSTGPSSTATQTRGPPVPPPRVPSEIRDARDGRDVCHWCPPACVPPPVRVGCTVPEQSLTKRDYVL